MDTGHDCRRIQTAHDQASDAKRKCRQPLDTSENGILRPHEDRSDDRKCEITCHKDTDQRSYKEIQNLRNNLVELLLDR